LSSATSHEHAALLRGLAIQREHIFEALDGLPVDDLRRPVLPSHWTCLGLVNHLSVDVERFWFQAVVAGEPGAVGDVLASADNAWEVATDTSAGEVFGAYRRAIEQADTVIAACSLDAPPAWWPGNLFGTWRLGSVREIVLHVLAETATHAGHLDAARELIDGKQNLVLTD